GADGAAALRRGQLVAQRLLEAEHRGAQHGPRPARVRPQRVAERTPLARGFDDVGEQREEGAARGGEVPSAFRARHEFVEPVREDRFEQPFLGGEVPVHGSGAHPRRARDQGERDGRALRRHGAPGRPEDGGAVPPGVGPKALRRSAHVTKPLRVLAAALGSGANRVIRPDSTNGGTAWRRRGRSWSPAAPGGRAARSPAGCAPTATGSGRWCATPVPRPARNRSAATWTTSGTA